MVEGLADAEHHGGGGAHAQLVRVAVDVDPVVGGALQARDLVADFVVENFRAAAGNGFAARRRADGRWLSRRSSSLTSAMARISGAEKQCS